MAQTKLLQDPIKYADIILAAYVQGDKDAEKFIAYMSENIPRAREARGLKAVPQAKDAKSEEKVRSDTVKPAQIVKHKKKKGFSLSFLRKLIPVGIGILGFIIGFGIVMPFVSLLAIPFYGFVAACLVTIGGIWYAKVWKEENLDDDGEPEEPAHGKKKLSL